MDASIIILGIFVLGLGIGHFICVAEIKKLGKRLDKLESLISGDQEG